MKKITAKNSYVPTDYEIITQFYGTDNFTEEIVSNKPVIYCEDTQYYYWCELRENKTNAHGYIDYGKDTEPDYFEIFYVRVENCRLKSIQDKEELIVALKTIRDNLSNYVEIQPNFNFKNLNFYINLLSDKCDKQIIVE